MRIIKALLVALLVGAIVAASVNSVPWWDPFRFWGLFFGSFAALITFGFALMFFGRQERHIARAARIVAAIGLLIFGGLVSSWILMWGVTPFTLEGAWIYPLAAAPLIAAGMLFCSRKRRKHGTWDVPPS